MSGIVNAIIIIGVLGAVLGLLLGIANIYLKVEVDPRIEKLTGMLPGYNCGACGFAGCASLAENIIEEGGSVKACTPCSAENKAKIMAFLKEA
ncbi:MAG TPA: electron transporter RnfB [Firmicutes bacterium]|nr:electron transporter RnfB [Bacillota bacterium]